MKLVNSIDYYYILHRDLPLKSFLPLDLQPLIIYLSLFVFFIVIVLSAYYLYREYVNNRKQRGYLPKNNADNPPSFSQPQEGSALLVQDTKDKTALEPQIQQQTRKNTKYRSLINPNEKPLSPQALKSDNNLFKNQRGVFNTATQRYTPNTGSQNAAWALIIDPPYASPGDMINIYISVTSRVFREQTHIINLTIESQVLYTDTIHLAGKERLNLRFPIYAGPPGVWTIELNGVSTRLQVVE